MIERIPGGTTIAADASAIVEIYRSINENMMSAESYPTQLSEAVVVSVRADTGIDIFVHYYMYDDEVGLLYREMDAVTPQNYTSYRDLAVDSVESMGFILENKNYRKLPDTEKGKLLATLLAFGGKGRKVGAFANSKTQLQDSPSVFLLDETVHEAAALPKKNTLATATPVTAESTNFQLNEATWNIFFRFVASL